MWRFFIDPVDNYKGVLGYFFLCHIFYVSLYGIHIRILFCYFVNQAG